MAGCSKGSTTQPATCDNNGTHLMAFASDRGQPAGQYRIWLYDLDGQGFRVLRNLAGTAGVDSSPSLSSDGQLVAFTRTNGGSHSVLVYDRATCSFAGRVALGAGSERDPAFTGNALRLAFARDTLGHRRIRLLNADGNLVPLKSLGADHPWDDWAPAPDRDADHIAFVSNRVDIGHPDGNPHVFVYDYAGDSLLATPGLSAPGRDIEPCLTPDSRWLAFASDRAGGAGGFDVYVYDLAADTLVALPNLNGPSDDRRPSIRSDGGFIVFESNRTGGQGRFDLWNWLKAAGTAPAQLTQESSASDDLHPSLVWP